MNRMGLAPHSPPALQPHAITREPQKHKQPTGLGAHTQDGALPHRRPTCRNDHSSMRCSMRGSTRTLPFMVTPDTVALKSPRGPDPLTTTRMDVEFCKVEQGQEERWGHRGWRPNLCSVFWSHGVFRGSCPGKDRGVGLKRGACNIPRASELVWIYPRPRPTIKAPHQSQPLLTHTERNISPARAVSHPFHRRTSPISQKAVRRHILDSQSKHLEGSCQKEGCKADFATMRSKSICKDMQL